MAMIVAEAAPVRPGRGRVGSLAVTLLQVWAPAARSVGAVVDGVAVPLQAAGGGWWRADVPAAVHGTDYGFLLDDDATPLPDPRTSVAAARRARPVPGLRPRPVRAGPTPAGAGVALQGSVVYELHVGTFTAEGTLDAADRAPRPPGRARRRPGRADAGRRLPGTARLGVRRRAPVRRPRALRRPGRAQALRRRLPPARARRLPGRRLQPPRARPATTCRGSGRTSPTSTTRRGARRSTSTTRVPTRCGAGSSTTPSAGCATSTSTRCGWTPCTRWSTTRRCTCWPSWPARSTPCPARYAGRWR